LKLISHPIRWNLPNPIFRKGTHCARHMCENPETLSIAWMHQGPLNPGVPARHLLVDTTWIWALNRRRRRLQAPFSLIPILFHTTVDSTTVARYCCCRPYLCRVCKKSNFRCSNNSQRICDTRLYGFVQRRSDPDDSPTRVPSHEACSQTDIYESSNDHTCSCKLLQLSAEWLGLFVACRRKGVASRERDQDRIYTKRRPWRSDPAAIVKKHVSTSSDGCWIGGTEASMLRPCLRTFGRLLS
jgi:hypothetical protein